MIEEVVLADKSMGSLAAFRQRNLLADEAKAISDYHSVSQSQILVHELLNMLHAGDSQNVLS